MDTERIKDIQSKTAYPDSLSVQQALMQVWNECAQEQQLKNCNLQNVSGSLRLLDEMYKELRLKAKEGFETPQELWINSEHQNAILYVRRLIQKREVRNDR